MTYWDLMIREILNKGKEEATYCFMPQGLGAGGGGGSGSSSAATKKRKRLSTKKTYLLGPKFPGIYLTLQEARCVYEALKGKTLEKIGATLILSPRTVEYYFEKIRRKLNCKTKAELIEKISGSDFLQNYDAS